MTNRMLTREESDIVCRDATARAYIKISQENKMADKKKNGIDPTSYEAIHGKTVAVGKETGERVAKKATSAIKLRKSLRDKYLMET